MNRPVWEITIWSCHISRSYRIWTRYVKKQDTIVVYANLSTCIKYKLEAQMVIHALVKKQDTIVVYTNLSTCIRYELEVQLVIHALLGCKQVWKFWKKTWCLQSGENTHLVKDHLRKIPPAKLAAKCFRYFRPEALKSLYRSPGYKKNQLVLCKNYVLRWWPSWISDRHKKPKRFRGPSNDYSWTVWFQLSKWFKRRSVLKHFSHRVQC